MCSHQGAGSERTQGAGEAPGVPPIRGIRQALLLRTSTTLLVFPSPSSAVFFFFTTAFFSDPSLTPFFFIHSLLVTLRGEQKMGEQKESDKLSEKDTKY